jgi:CO dehydrogenase/acetyl-CoA synthase beta subunit
MSSKKYSKKEIEFFKYLHEKATNNRKEIEKNKNNYYFCYHCQSYIPGHRLQIFTIDNCAVCPVCKVDSIVNAFEVLSDGFVIYYDGIIEKYGLLTSKKEIYDYWFGSEIDLY